MKLGFDVDGVFADFNSSFIERVVVVTGRDLFPPRPFDIPCWDYPEHYGYTREETSAVWQGIEKDRTFWLNLSPYDGAMDILERIRVLSIDHDHDVYFITSRPGIGAKGQTETWLATHSGDFLWNPTVLVSGDKGRCAKALKLDYYIDDRFENCLDVAVSGGGCQTFLMDRPWNNRADHEDDRLTRVDAVSEMLDALPDVSTRLTKNAA